jgi:hypothetical protein
MNKWTGGEEKQEPLPPWSFQASKGDKIIIIIIIIIIVHANYQM